MNDPIALFRDLVEGDEVALATATPGVASARAYSKEESAGLLEPWLGKGLALDDLPVPRMIVVKAAAGTKPDTTSASSRTV